MSEQVVLLTGALTGIGRATAIAFATEGAKSVVSGRHDKEGQKLAIELRNLGTEAEFVRADVRHEGDIEKLVDYALSRFGRLDLAVNNAGTEVFFTASKQNQAAGRKGTNLIISEVGIFNEPN
jgi:NAD(P)-dependent dehydrogenase (short-subunit alcohol dehydrogenase family)